MAGVQSVDQRLKSRYEIYLAARHRKKERGYEKCNYRNYLNHAADSPSGDE